MLTDLTFIHAADLHLDSPFYGISHLPEPIFARIKESTFSSVRHIIDAAITENVDFVLLAGDLFDEANRSLKAQLFLKKQFDRLREYGISVYVIFGNHDHLGGEWTSIEWPANVHMFTSPVPEEKSFYKDGRRAASIYGFSYQTRAVTENQAARYRRSTDAPFHIGMLHGTLSGSEGHDPYCPFTQDDLVKSGMDYWALGHIHKRQVLSAGNPAVIYPGNPQARHMKETGDKGFYLVRVERGDISYEFKKAHDVLWEKAEVNVSAIENMTALFQIVEDTFSKLRKKGTPACVKLVLQGIAPEWLSDAPRGSLDELLEAFQEQEVDEENFIWPLSLEDETENEAELKSLDPFFGGLLEDIEQTDLAGVLEGLERHPVYRRHADRFSQEEIKEIKEQAQVLLKRQLKVLES
ncbi:metallophosphoesterase family protein [Bacillus halotolerans]|uniref:metallophosphoesterase family protein n=1 Tax=Bacillus halotolerans TaxID=260554 RepID=UPI002DBA5065|nr:DNA repair exonuclease [Bacillus halotolerans]MEC1648355.1 DNA repair exonuclease [Bacillus halotolerans]